MNVNLIGVPINYGCDIEGSELGPSVLRENHILDIIRKSNYKVHDLGDIPVPKVSIEDKYFSHRNMKYLDPIIEVATNLAHEVYSSLQGGNFPFIIGGDHSLSLGSIAGASKNFKDMAVIWVDAHPDINTDITSPSGNIHGMPLAASMNIGHSILSNIYFKGQKVKPENIYIIGARDIDPGEFQLAKNLNLNLYTMDIVREKGLENILNIIQDNIKNSGVDGVHFSFDIDVLDKSIVPGTGTAVNNGFYIDEVNLIFSKLLSQGFVTSMDFVELNPLLDHSDGKTTKTCIDMIQHIFNVLLLK